MEKVREMLEIVERRKNDAPESTIAFSCAFMRLVAKEIDESQMAEKIALLSAGKSAADKKVDQLQAEVDRAHRVIGTLTIRCITEGR